jgi:Ca2+-binding RTX toxin-like protein
MCQGKPATIVWEGGSGGVGTDGDDVIVARPHADDIRISTGDGDDLLCLGGSQPPDPYYFDVRGGDGEDSIEVRLGDEPNKLQVFEFEGLDIDLGGGFDKLMIGAVHGTGSIDGGAGGAALQIRAIRLDVNLLSETIRIDDGLYTLTHFQRVSAWAQRRLEMTGDNQDNGFRAKGCRVTLRGGGGDDVLTATTRPYECKTPKMRLAGEGGNDRLVGSPSADVLLGGPGRDTADGMRGKDKCTAETERNCER